MPEGEIGGKEERAQCSPLKCGRERPEAIVFARRQQTVISPGLDEPFSFFRQFESFPGHKRLQLIVGQGDLPMPGAPMSARKLAIDPKPFI